MGVLSDLLGRKRMIVLGTFGSGVLFPIFVAMATSVAGLQSRIAIAIVAFVVLAGTFSANFSGTVAFIGDATPDARSGEFMGLLWTALGVGGVLGPLLLGSIATFTGYQISFLVAAGLAVIATLVVALGIDAGPAAA
jgi:MFS family permease